MSRTLPALAVLALAAGLGGCLPGAGGAPLSPETAVSACEAPTALALRARYPDFQSLVLAPAAASRVEARATQVGRQPVATVVAGHGTSRAGNEIHSLRYTCLLAPDGEAVFVDVETGDGSQVLAECGPPGNPAAARGTCLAGLLRRAEQGLAEAEAKAVAHARQGQHSTPAAAIDDPAATSIGAWRIYREGECRRRAQGAPPARQAELADACRIELTRARVGELAS